MADAPSTPPRHKHLTRDQRLQIQTLRLAGHTYAFIANLLNVSVHQVGYAAAQESVTPTKRSGRPRTLIAEQIDELVEHVRQYKDTRQMSYLALAQGPFKAWGVGQCTIRNALRSRGYARRSARSNQPPAGANQPLDLAPTGKAKSA